MTRKMYLGFITVSGVICLVMAVCMVWAAFHMSGDAAGKALIVAAGLVFGGFCMALTFIVAQLEWEVADANLLARRALMKCEMVERRVDHVVPRYVRSGSRG